MTTAQYNNDSVVERKRAFLEQESCATRISLNYFDKRVLMAFEEERFDTYITKLLDRVQECYIAEVTENFLCIRLLENKKSRTRTSWLCCQIS